MALGLRHAISATHEESQAADVESDYHRCPNHIQELKIQLQTQSLVFEKRRTGTLFLEGSSLPVIMIFYDAFTTNNWHACFCHLHEGLYGTWELAEEVGAVSDMAWRRRGISQASPRRRQREQWCMLVRKAFGEIVHAFP